MLCLLPRDSLFWLRATLGTLYPGRISGDQHSPKQMFRHSGQLVWQLCTIYLLGCLWCCPERHLGSSKSWHGLRRQESILSAYPIRSEKRIIYHKHSLICFMFLILFFGKVFWCFFFVVGCFCVPPPPQQIQGQSHTFFLVICGITSLVTQETMPTLELTRNARKCYSNLSVVCISQSYVGHVKS